MTPDRETLAAEVERLEDALTRVQWVRNGTGTGYHCHFCGGVSIQDGGDDHADDCEWVRLTRGDVSKQVAEQVRELAQLQRDADFTRHYRQRIAARLEVPLPRAEGEVWDAVLTALDKQAEQAQEIARLREALTALIIDADLLCDGFSGGAFDQCRRTLAKVKEALK